MRLTGSQVGQNTLQYGMAVMLTDVMQYEVDFPRKTFRLRNLPEQYYTNLYNTSLVMHWDLSWRCMESWHCRTSQSSSAMRGAVVKLSHLRPEYLSRFAAFNYLILYGTVFECIWCHTICQYEFNNSYIFMRWYEVCSWQMFGVLGLAYKIW